jgi:FMN phosphatase YigB (HAD superfamily)
MNINQKLKNISSIENNNSYILDQIIYSKIFTVNEDVALLLPELKKKYKLILLSNTNEIHREYGWKDYSFLKYFDISLNSN